MSRFTVRMTPYSTHAPQIFIKGTTNAKAMELARRKALEHYRLYGFQRFEVRAGTMLFQYDVILDKVLDPSTRKWSLSWNQLL